MCIQCIDVVAINDVQSLTPNQLLQLTDMNRPPGLFIKWDYYASRRWKQTQYLAGLLWHRW